jgi:hypothetical protein
MSLINWENYYLFWMIPSVFSFLLSALMALNILMIPALRSRVYQQLLAVLALSDLVKSGSWLIGVKYREPYLHCAIQEYLFQAGSLAEALCVVLICAVLIYTVSVRKTPTYRIISSLVALSCSVLFICLSLNIYYRTAGIFCGSVYSGLSAPSLPTEVYVYLLSFLLVTFICISIHLLSYIWITWFVKRLRLDWESVGQLEQMNILASRLRAYPLIFGANYVPLVIALVLPGIHLSLAIITAICASSTGALISLNYFYYQKTIAPFIVSFVNCVCPGSSWGRSVNRVSVVLAMDDNENYADVEVDSVVFSETWTSDKSPLAPLMRTNSDYSSKKILDAIAENSGNRMSGGLYDDFLS